MREFGPGDEVADEIYPDDGRQTDGRRGDWGKHRKGERLDYDIEPVVDKKRAAIFQTAPIIKLSS